MLATVSRNVRQVSRSLDALIAAGEALTIAQRSGIDPERARALAAALYALPLALPAWRFISMARNYARKLSPIISAILLSAIVPGKSAALISTMAFAPKYIP